MAPETASAAQTSRWGVQVSSTVKLEPPRACRSAARHLPAVGEPVDQLRRARGRRRGSPPAAPGPGRGHRLPALVDALARARARRAAVAPVTSAPWLSMWTDVAATVGAGPGWVAVSCGRAGRGGERAGPGPAAGRRVEGELVDVPAGAGGRGAGARRVVPGRGLHDVGPGAERDALGVGPARDELRLAAVEGVLGRTRRRRRRSAGRRWRAGWTRSCPGRVAGVGFARTPGMPISAMPSGSASGPAE